MHNKLQLTVVTPAGIVFQDEVDGAIALGREGYFGVRANHAPLIAELQVGDLRIRTGEHWQAMAVSGGMFELRDGQAVVLTEAAELAGQIDVARARAALQRAQSRLDESLTNGDIDVDRAQAAMARAMARLRVAEGGIIDT